MKIAILITAYKNEKQLNWLVEHLSKDFDVYVHIDKRSSISVKESERVHLYKKYKSYWGSYNTVLAVLFLLSEASKKNYDRYVQITGQDLPIKSNKQIIEFFTNHKDSEFIESFKIPSDAWKNGGLDRVTRYWGIEPSKLAGFERFTGTISKLCLRMIYKLPISFLFTRTINFQFYGGSNYMDLTGNCINKILEFLNGNKNYLNRFKHTCIPEEIFFQTTIKQVEPETVLENKVLRYIDWKTGPDFPRTFTLEDYQRIVDSEYLFARKFDNNKDSEIIEKIYKNIS
jgi:hypothetical protein